MTHKTFTVTDAALVPTGVEGRRQPERREQSCFYSEPQTRPPALVRRTVRVSETEVRELLCPQSKNRRCM